MQLISINISNLLSFPYQEHFSEEKKIHFDVHKKWGLNILIWPNWSGKTNFLEIISQIIKIGLIKDFVYQENNKEPDQSIKENQWPLENMKPHFSYTDKPSTVDIEFHISTNDKENMLFIQKEKDIFSQIIKTYSTIKYDIPTCNSNKIKNLQTLHIQFSIDTQNKTAHIINKQKNKTEAFALHYLIYQELFQLGIMIYNTKIKKSDELGRYPLKNTFGQLYNTRNFYHLKKESNNHNLREEFIKKKNYRENNSLLGYALCIKKLHNIISHTSEENRNEIIKENTITEKYVEQQLNHSLFYNSLKKSIKKYLELDIKVKYENNHIELLFINSLQQEQTIHSISNGEQSLLIILLTIYGYDLKDGLLIIDEPELHFHPQMQRRLAKMLEKLNENIGTQCIISTYSPIFIDEKNITNVYRFSKKNWETQIRIPDKTIGHDESSLIQILKFENAAKIFFVDKIIMVEGEIDAYFFEHYLQYLHNLPEGKEKIKNYEIININGKWSYKKRSTFLKKFWIESYFIWDWDNIVDYWYITQQDLNYYYKQAKTFHHNHKNNETTDQRYYARLVNAVKYLYPNKYSTILEKIELLYGKNIFILKRWDIETYLWIKSKWLEETIAFCHNFFDNRLENKNLLEHRKELENIIFTIFSQ